MKINFKIVFFAILPLCLMKNSFSKESWYIDGCNIVEEIPRVNGNTTRGSCNVNERLEYRRVKTYPIADIDLTKGRLCADQTKCILETYILYKGNEKYLSCTEEIIDEEMNGELMSFPRSILNKAIALQQSCKMKKLNAERSAEKDVRQPEQKRKATSECDRFYPGKPVKLAVGEYTLLFGGGTAYDQGVVVGVSPSNGLISFKITKAAISPSGKEGTIVEVSCSDSDLQ